MVGMKSLYGRPRNPALPPAPSRSYSVVLADPPWATYGEARAKYEQMALDDICAIPVSEWTKEDSALFLWVPNWRIEWGLEVVRAWEFKYRTIAFVWVKTNKEGRPVSGMGYWTRPGVEVCLLGVRGNPLRGRGAGSRNATVEQVVLAPRGAHSEKPIEIYSRVERMLGGSYLEMFARKTRPGWDAWGNEVGKLDSRPPA